MPTTNKSGSTEKGGLKPDAARVLRQFRIIFNAVRRHFRATETKAGISGAHAWALGIIRDHPGIGVNDLAEGMDVHQSTASNLLRTLLAQKLVVAQRDDFDQRAVRLSITAAGSRKLRSAPDPYTGVLPGALANLDAAALKRLAKDLDGLVAALGAPQDASQIPLGQAEPARPARPRPAAPAKAKRKGPLKRGPNGRSGEKL